MGLAVRKIPSHEVLELLAQTGTHADNPRWKPERFLCFFSHDAICQDSPYSFCGLFLGTKCLAMACTRTTNYRTRLVVLLESAHKGAGKTLLAKLISAHERIWWGVDPNGGEPLLAYYRRRAGEPNPLGLG